MGKIPTGNIGIRDSNLNLMYTSLITNTILQQRIQVGAVTAVPLPTIAMSERVFLQVQNDGNASIFLGSSTVTATGATKGIRLRPGAVATYAIEPDVTMYVISESGTQDVVLLEGS